MQLDWNLALQHTVTGNETTITPSLNSKACNGNMPSLQAPEVQAAGISWQDNVHYFLGCWRCRPNCLMTLSHKVSVTYRALKRSVEKSWPSQCTCSHVICWISCFTWIWIWRN